jgi:hypothetical protein
MLSIDVAKRHRSCAEVKKFYSITSIRTFLKIDFGGFKNHPTRAGRSK